MWTADLLCIVSWCLATLDQLVAVYLKPKFTAVSWFDWDHAAAIIGSIVVHTVDDIMQNYHWSKNLNTSSRGTLIQSVLFSTRKYYICIGFCLYLEHVRHRLFQVVQNRAVAVLPYWPLQQDILHNSDVIPVLWIFVSFQRVCRFPSQSMEICLSPT